MLRPVSLLPALAAVATALASLGLVAPAAGATTGHRAEEQTPLAVTIDSLAPSTIPARGPITVTGTVTNRDDGAWRAIKLYAFASATPMTTTAEVAAATETPESTDVGQRIIDLARPATQFSIDQLAPGTTTTFTLRIPRRDLPVTAPGVYWFGVHALGEGPEGREDGADGRARTFLPLVPARTTGTLDTSLVVPVRRGVEYQPDGRVDDVEGWTASLSTGGRLDQVAQLGLASVGHPITWVVDPAVIDAARRLAAGNPARSLAPTLQPGEGKPDDADPSDGASPSGGSDPSSDPSPSDDADTDAGDGGSGDGDDGKPDAATEAAARAATAWLERMRAALQDDEILVLPYGDTDVPAAAAHDPSAYRTARDRSGTVLQPWGLPATPVVSSPTGYLPAGAVRLAGEGTTVLMSDAAVGDDAPTVADTAGHRVVLSTSATATGGPGPEDRLTPVALRQRILSDAALHLLTEDAEPLVVQLPRAFTPSSTTEFFRGLGVGWLRLARVGTVAAHPPREVAPGDLVYPEADAERELTAYDFSGATDLIRSGATLQNLLTLNDQVGGTVRDEALTNLGYADRADPSAARLAASRARSWVEEQLHAVTIEAPKAVILASGSGRFSATISNRLDQPVSVRLAADADPPLRVAVPDRTYDVASGARTSILLNASNPGLGVRTVTLRLVDTDGASLGSSDAVPMRSNRVSNVIWLIMGTGIALLVGAIGVRLARRVRAARRG